MCRFELLFICVGSSVCVCVCEFENEMLFICLGSSVCVCVCAFEMLFMCIGPSVEDQL